MNKMTQNKIKYRKLNDWKYKLHEDYTIYIDIFGKDIRFPKGRRKYITLDNLGVLTIHACYAWDGASGPAIDTKNFMRGSLVHDALYQLMRAGEIETKYRNYADKLLKKICRQDGMSRFRAWYVFHAVDKFGKSSAARSKKNDYKVFTAP